MTESIGTQLYALLSGVLPLNFSEAETEDYPYAVYDAPITPVRSKDGIIKFSSTVTITVYAKDFSTAGSKADAIIAALESGMRNAQYTAALVTNTSSRVEGIWSVELVYTINQYS